MQICVCGWYFGSPLYEMLGRVNKKYQTAIVCHGRPGFDQVVRSLTYVYKPNVGLEFGAYDYFIKAGFWDNRESVLFMHDDVSISDETFFDDMAALTVDQRFVFRDEANAKANQNFHGRMFYASPEFLRAILAKKCDCAQAYPRVDYHNNHFCSESCAKKNAEEGKWSFPIVACKYKPKAQRKRCTQCGTVIPGDDFWGVEMPGSGVHTGFWFDPWNRGHSRGCPPIGVRHYNDSIYHMALQVSRMKSETMDTGGFVCSPKINLHKRGEPT